MSSEVDVPRYSIVELYSCLSGEEPTSGLPTTIVRFSGCNLNCWSKFGGCDTPNRCGDGREMSISEIVSEISVFGMPHVLVTGGEPLLDGNALPLLTELSKRRAGCVREVSVETNGSISIEGVPGSVRVVMDGKCPSSGESDTIVFDNFDLMGPRDVLKFVVADHDDFKFAEDVIFTYGDLLLSRGVSLVVSPLWDVCKPQDLVGWLCASQIKTVARMQLQMHKVIYGGKSQLV